MSEGYVVRAGVVLGAAVFCLFLVAALPGLNRLLPLAPNTLTTFMGAIMALVITGVLVGVAPHIETVVKDALSGPADIVAGEAATRALCFPSARLQRAQHTQGARKTTGSLPAKQPVVDWFR